MYRDSIITIRFNCIKNGILGVLVSLMDNCTNPTQKDILSGKLLSVFCVIKSRTVRKNGKIITPQNGHINIHIIWFKRSNLDNNVT